jgi:hypothetical protein
VAVKRGVSEYPQGMLYKIICFASLSRQISYIIGTVSCVRHLFISPVRSIEYLDKTP